MDRLSLSPATVWTVITISDKSTNDYSITDMTSENNQMFKNESEKNSVKYSCKKCGNPFNVNPPDDVHKFSSVYPCWDFDWVERSYECSKCTKSTKLFWHPKLHKHHHFATVEEIEYKTSKNSLGNHPGYMLRMRGY
jgi:DNA-directed RNA polymerase subunit RPC12/RpoP